MKTILSAAFIAAFLFGTQAVADDTKQTQPLKLTEIQMDKVTAGVGANNIALAPWGALNEKAGHSLNHNLSSDASPQFDGVTTGVAVPGAVPNSVCLAFC